MLPPRARVCAGFSGGLDSTVLLDLLVPAARAGAIELTALHVHHGLSPNADAWADACAAFCAARGVPLAVERVRVERAGEGLESAARQARYAAYARRDVDCIALAHHREDQAETVLLQLLRGTGLKGASGMPEARALGAGGPLLFRPLLDIPRDAILEYAREHALAWVDDESNAARQADRNFLRHDVAPLLDARFPGWRGAVSRFARHAQAAQAATDEGALPAFDEAARLELRRFLEARGLRMPSAARATEMARQLFAARPDAQVRLVHDGAIVTRYRGQLHVQPMRPADEPWRVPWRGEAAVALGADRGEVHFERAAGEGLAAAVAGGDCHFGPRRGGERLRPRAGGPSRTLKNLLQERGIPPWERLRLPLLFDGDRLVWAPGIGIDASYACRPGETGLKPCWRVARNATLVLE